MLLKFSTGVSRVRMDWGGEWRLLVKSYVWSGMRGRLQAPSWVSFRILKRGEDLLGKMGESASPAFIDLGGNPRWII